MATYSGSFGNNSNQGWTWVITNVQLAAGEYPTKVELSGGTWSHTTAGDNSGVKVGIGNDSTSIWHNVYERTFAVGETPSCTGTWTGSWTNLTGVKLKAGFRLGNGYNHVGATNMIITTSIRTYTITWQNDDGSALTPSTTIVTHGATPSHDSPTKSATASTVYTFAAWQRLVDGQWTDGVVQATANTTYKARYAETARQYTVEFLNWDGTVLQTGAVDYGQTPTYNGATPQKTPIEQYEFSGWNDALTPVTEDTTYIAQFAIRKYTITWKSEGTTLETDTGQAYGSTPEYNGATPQKASTAEKTFTFSGWSPAVAQVEGDTTYTATFSESAREYSINAVCSPEGAGRVTAPAKAAWGTVVSISQTPAADYEFVGWAISNGTIAGNRFTMPKTNVTLTAIYREAHKTIGYYDGNRMVECVASYFDGTRFVEVEPQYFDGTQWKPCSMT